jgi:hypothetical protein
MGISAKNRTLWTVVFMSFLCSFYCKIKKKEQGENWNFGWKEGKEVK